MRIASAYCSSEYRFHIYVTMLWTLCKISGSTFQFWFVILTDYQMLIRLSEAISIVLGKVLIIQASQDSTVISNLNEFSCPKKRRKSKEVIHFNQYSTEITTMMNSFLELILITRFIVTSCPQKKRKIHSVTIG